MLLFVYTTTHERFVIFTCRYFSLSRKYHCSKPIKLQKFLISHACNSRKGDRARRSLVRDRGKQQEQSLKMCQFPHENQIFHIISCSFCILGAIEAIGFFFFSLFIYKKIIIINTCSFASVVSTKTWPLWLTLLGTFEIISLRQFKVSQGLFCLF